MQTVKRICYCLITVSLLVISLGWLKGLLERKDSVFRYHHFFEKREDLDVLFFGTSHVIYGIFPMELWGDYGITSYNCGGHANALPTTYWLMKNILDYASPEIIVVDGYLLNYSMKTNNFSNVHGSLDAFPLSRTKMYAVWDLLHDEEMEELIRQGMREDAAERKSLSLLWDFSVYHSRWSELEKNDFLTKYSKEGGAQFLYNVAVPDQIPEVSADVCLKGDTVGIEYLTRMIRECKDRGIRVLLTYLPFPASEQDQMDANRLYDIAQEYDVPYINFLDKDIVNYETDCYDPNSHLNISGARKVTDYLGAYMTEHYDLADHRMDAAYDSWHGDYDAYQEMKISNLKQQQALNVYLMCLADKNFNVLIETKNPQIWKDERYQALFQNMGLDTARVTKRTDAVFIQEMGVQTEYLKDFCDWQRFGMDGGMGENEDLRITVFEKESMERADTAVFILQEDTFIRQTG